MENENSSVFGNPVDSSSLQERHAEIYEKFFAIGDIVISTNATSAMQIGGSWRVGGPFLSFKLPFRAYLSIEFMSESESIILGKMLMHDRVSDTFEDTDMDYAIPSRLIDMANKMMNELMNDMSWRGVRVNILYEADPRHQGYDTSYASLIAVMLFLLSGKTDSFQINQMATLTAKDIRKGETDLAKLFLQIHTLAFHLTSVLYNHVSSGSAAMDGMLATKSPQIYFLEERMGSDEKKFKGLLPIMSEDPSVYENIHKYIYTLDEFAPDASPTMPFDLVSIFPGRARAQRQVSYYLNETFIPGFDLMRDRVNEMFADTISSDGAPPWLQNTKTDGLYWQQYSRGNAIQMLELIISLVDAYRHRVEFGRLSRFLELVTLMGAGYRGLSSKRIRTMIDYVRRASNEAQVPIGIHNNSYRQFDGNLNVFSPRQMFRSDLLEEIERMRDEINGDISIDYVSWRDGYGSEGIRVDQHVDAGIRSSFIPLGAVKITQYDGDTVSTSVERTFTLPQADIVLDLSKGKVFINGETISSKETPSQKATVALLVALLTHDRSLGKEEMPDGSYFSYRNELQGKIVSPLNKLIKETFERELGIEITGGLTRFQVRWKHDGLSIATVEPIE